MSSERSIKSPKDYCRGSKTTLLPAQGRNLYLHARWACREMNFMMPLFNVRTMQQKLLKPRCHSQQ